ncbi:nuclear transport factor 2 family protein [Neorhizobium galegae]|uniref:nuclear transport factor 2 family protein n=1 Tax=Neorhizobium galegae TaxID=399 RepID=UPI000621CCEC|nr:nuclear transport factor 2 family protein [Neorhizobium galegae]MCQ1807313.1 nuclear transport factor 2 family protein [Neorhizobium galegae]CDZ61823.1 Putative integron gene cassette protein [Neorhizobium galegae bv. orientalis]
MEKPAFQPADRLVGRTFKFELGALSVRYTFNSLTEATFLVLSGAGMVEDGYVETVQIDAREVRPNVFVNSWREASGATVSHLEDFENGILLSNVTLPDGRLVRLAGTIKEESGRHLPLSNKAIVTTAMHELFEKRDVSALERYWREPYIQHSPQMPSGLGTLRTVVPALEGFSWTPHRIVSEGDLVMTHSRVMGWGPKPQIIVDVFRLQHGRIVEHWDVVQEEILITETVSGESMI